jgi:TatD DNase family protein
MTSFPLPGDFIDIHNHSGSPSAGRFNVENLMAHEERVPVSMAGQAYTVGIHPWHYDSANHEALFSFLGSHSSHPDVIALGEAGFDRLRGPEMTIQREVFERQARLSEKIGKPLFIHCVRSWDELLGAHKRIIPEMPWIVHGFRGKRELAMQLISKNMYISFWFEFIMRPESSVLVRSLPAERIFLETDGSGVDIKDIYLKVAADINIDVEQLKDQILGNFNKLFVI